MSKNFQKDFPPMKNDLILRAARGETTERVPVWIMRQAGRYLPEFLKFKEEHGNDFFHIVQTPNLACEITLQPIRRFDLDAAIIFSDILVIPQALGMTCEMVKGKGPHFPEPLREPEDIKKLNENVVVEETLGYLMDAITLTRHKLEGKVPLIGFSGAPWTLMAYMIEGGGSKTTSNAKKWLYKHSEATSLLLQKLTNVIVDYLVAQVRAGAQMLQVFESCAECLSPYLFTLYAFPHLEEIAVRVKQRLGKDAVPMVIFAKGASYAIRELSQSSYDVIGLDWTVPVEDARLQAPNCVLQGNLDPCGLYASKDDLIRATKSMVRSFGTKKYIANLGHGIYPDMDPEQVKIFIDTIHSYSESLNNQQKA
ncbi:Uroporphyrinogen decarboxylase [Paramuricea clavata]|uniref:Uroporphyrinogen decarboxylase n=1 Tax=Paramuricea clavata TaxID=317549 RepID=A0A6S7G8Q9_PARCT|nr:Uroporphyrinogen decarboxylase [Paramuricea clavata]